MAILLNADTRILVQGMTGWAGTHHTTQMMEYGSRVVAGVRPGKGGRSHLNLPVFDGVRAAKEATGADASIVFVPPASAGAAMLEAIEAEIPLVVAVTERVPVLDMVRVREALKGSRTTLVGANSQGVLSPGLSKLGVMATGGERPGVVGVASRSASLTSEVVAQITAAGLGQSTTVGVGGDPVHGLSMRECLELFLADPDTRGVVLIGEIGGTEEQEVAEFVAGAKPSKPIVALIVGAHAPAERRMGHAGALALNGAAAAAAKTRALEKAGVRVAPSADLVGRTIADALARTH
ncbi:succinate--CoA ligase [ADP-forming] subunit alpha [Methylopila jiangsuensis]|uniref:Succinate--CoA ligase [ADP-forming] subunit alpha n=1 Tax=Methylopila jiangsuensis TaxID=586230 RepID=A0A9W6JH43_9HYPH|nr:succinate--CoA ligase subunit alpha [Methylopila jiangsuensis]MDR6285093.1 succinyl-CoA synthetase alpha subunit [Methylopila jiangsuensis]GLK77520.1 succinate--CoA ligase [ADP-forming] subunit alpha [Methylopila jiangsuensis]